MLRKTKIVCTLGPATDREGVLEQLALSGMNVARFNFSHQTHDEHKRRIEQVRAIRDKHSYKYIFIFMLALYCHWIVFA